MMTKDIPKKVYLSLAGFLLLFTNASAETQKYRARLDFIPEYTQAKPGQVVELGLYFQIEPDWHTYWTNPGDAGLPVRAKWETIPPINIHDLEFPYPTRIPVNEFVSFGYKNENFVKTKFQVPENLKDGEVISIKGDFKWLICEEVCIPEKIIKEIQIKISNDKNIKNPDYGKISEKFRNHFPKKIVSPFEMADQGKQLKIIIPKSQIFSDAISNMDFFANDASQLENKAKPQFNIKTDHIELILKKNPLKTENIQKLTGILTLMPKNGTNKNIQSYELTGVIK